MEFNDEISSAFEQLLTSVRSVRRRIDFDREVEDDVLLNCINIAVQAPTGRGEEDWYFLVVKERQKIKAVSEIYREVLLEFVEESGVPMKSSHRALTDRLGEFPALIFACKDGAPGNSFASQVAYFGSILPAAWSLMIALRAKNIGATWTTLLTVKHQRVTEILGMPSSACQLIMLPVGYTREAVLKKAHRKDASEVTFLNEWGNSLTR